MLSMTGLGSGIYVFGFYLDQLPAFSRVVGGVGSLVLEAHCKLRWKDGLG